MTRSVEGEGDREARCDCKTARCDCKTACATRSPSRSTLEHLHPDWNTSFASSPRKRGPRRLGPRFRGDDALAALPRG